MKPSKTGITAISTLNSQSHVMGIDEKGMGTVLSILSNLYSDSALAVVREYSCNALDSHREAGNTEPILVLSPSALNPVLTVQDFGVGLSLDEVLNVYAKYGASTKRETDEQIGSFGIGAKSAFTVGSQFTVTAVKDGEKTIALFALNESGAPTVSILSHTETIEPNGVKVEIGVTDVRAVCDAITRSFKVWDRGTVLVDGVEPECIWDETKEITNGIHVRWRESKSTYLINNNWYIVMGGISYPIPRGLVENNLSYRTRNIVRGINSSLVEVYISVEIGDVDITPSREELRDTNKTIKLVTDKIEEFTRNLGPWVTQQIEDSNSMIEAMIKYRTIKSNFGHAISNLTDVTWNGKKVDVQGMKIPDLIKITLGRKRGNYYGAESVARREVNPILNALSPFESFVFVTDVPERRVRSVQLAAKEYLFSKSGNDRKYGAVFALTKPVSEYEKEWFSLRDPALMLVDFDTFIKEWKPIRAKVKREIVYVLADGDEITLEELRKRPRVYYVNHKDYLTGKLRREVSAGATIVCLKATQKASALFNRIPSAIDLRSAMEKRAREILDNLSQDEIDSLAGKKFLSKISGSVGDFVFESSSRLTCPLVASFIEQHNKATSLEHIDVERIREAIRLVGEPKDLFKSMSFDPSILDQIVEAYPLIVEVLNHYRFYPYHVPENVKNHLIKYVNLVAENGE